MNKKIKLGLYYKVKSDSLFIVEKSKEEGFDYRVVDYLKDWESLKHDTVRITNFKKDSFEHRWARSATKCKNAILIQPIYESWHEALKGVLGRDYKEFERLLIKSAPIGRDETPEWVNLRQYQALWSAFTWEGTPHGHKFWESKDIEFRRCRIGEL